MVPSLRSVSVVASTLVVTLALAATPAVAQSADFPTCYSTDVAGARTVSLPAGATAVLERLRGDEVEAACTIRVRDGGREIFAGEGFGTQVFGSPGIDLDGDHVPEVIVGVDSGGGNRCCWAYTVLRLGRRAGRLAELGFAPRVQTDAAGHAVLVETVPFYDLGPSMAQSPTVTRVHQFVKGTLTDVTRAHCASLLSPTSTGWASRADDWALVTTARAATSRQGPAADEAIPETRVAATSLALQLDYCGRATEAAALVRDVWPAAEVEAQQARIDASARSLKTPRR